MRLGFGFGVTALSAIPRITGGVLPSGPVNMLVVAGQSQAVTSNTQSEPVPSSVAAAPPNVFIWNPDLSPPAFEQYQAGVNSCPRNGFTRGAHPFGPEAEIVRRYAASGDTRPLCIVKLGSPTTALQEAARSTNRQIWDPTLSNELAARLKTDRDAAVAALGSRTINYLGALWDQGQNDGNNAAAAATYGTALDAFHAWFRANIMGGSTATFVVARLEDSASWSQRATVRAAQAAFYDRTPNTQLFSSDGLATGSDNVHFNAASTVTRGARAWAMMRPERSASLVARFTPSLATSVFADSAGTTQATIGSTVGRYMDTEGQPGLALLGSSGLPTLATDSITGRPVLSFAGGSKYLTSTAAKLIATANGNDNPITIVAAIRRGTADSGSRAFFGWSRKSTTSDYIRAGYSGAAGLYARTQNNTAVFAGLGNVFPEDKWYIATWIFSGQTVTLRVNGVTVAADVGCDVPALTLEEFSIGAVYAVANNGYVNSVTGALDEFRLFNVGSLTQEVQTAESEIAAAVGVTLGGGDTTAPSVTSASTGTTPENQAYSMGLMANEPVTWSLRTGDDSALFTLDGATLTLAARDFEVPQDGGADNIYIARLRATDAAGNVTDFLHTVTVTDVAEATLNQLTLQSPAYRNTMASGDVVAALNGLTSGSTLEILSDTGAIDVQGGSIVVGANRAPDAADTVAYGASPPTVVATEASQTGPFSVIETKDGVSRRNDFPSITVTGKLFPVAGQSTTAYLRTPTAQFETETKDQVIIIGYFRPDATIGSTAPLFGLRGPNGTEIAPALRMKNDGTMEMRVINNASIMSFGKIDIGKWSSVAGQMCTSTGGEFGSEIQNRARGVLDGRPINGTAVATTPIPVTHFSAVETASGTSGVKQTYMFYWMWYGQAAECPPINWSDPRNQKAILPDNINPETGVMTLYSDSGVEVTLTPKLFYHGKAQDYEGNGLANRGTAAVSGPLARVNGSAHWHPSTTVSAYVVAGDPTVVSQSRFSQDGTSMDFGSTAKEGGQFWNGDWWIDNAAGSEFTTLPLTVQRARNVDDGTVRPLEWINGAMKNPGNDADTQAYPVPPKPFPPVGVEGRDGNGDGSRQGFDECPLDVSTYTHALNAAVGTRSDTSGTFVKIASRSTAPKSGQYMAQGQAAYTLARPPLTAGEKYFRPPITSLVKDLWVRAEDANLDISMFPNLSPAGITVPPFFQVYYAINRLHQVWNLNKRNGYNECAASHEVSYGRNYASAIGKAVLLMCLSSTTTAQKYELARCLTQLGIDYTGVYEAGRVSCTIGLGATSIGRKLTLAVAAITTGNARILAASQAKDWMPEQFQIGTVTQDRITEKNYPQSMLGLHDWAGSRKSSVTSLSPQWVRSADMAFNWYRHVWMQGMFAHYVMMRLVPQLTTAMNWPEFMEYAERYYRVEMGLIPLPFEGTTYAAGACPGDGANNIKNADVIAFWQARQQFPSYFPA